MEILFLLFSEVIFLCARARARNRASKFPRAKHSLVAKEDRLTNVTQGISHSRERATFRRFIIVVRLEIFALSKKRMLLLRLSERPGRPCAL